MKYVHSLAGFQNPAVDPLVTLTLKGHKRFTAVPMLQKEPITADILLKLLGSHGHSNATLADLRTLFISLISYAGFLRFDDLIKITRKDCSISQDCEISQNQRMISSGKALRFSLLEHFMSHAQSP